MIAALATCAVLLVTATGCGSRAEEGDSPTGASDSSSSASESPSSSSESPSSSSESPSETPQTGTGLAGQTLGVGDTVEAGQAMVVSASNVDGPITPLASPLNDDQAVEEFASGLDARLGREVRDAVKTVEVPEGTALYGSVVTVGCDRPSAVSWKTTPQGIETTAEVPKSNVQCLVPVTSVALFLVTHA